MTAVAAQASEGYRIYADLAGWWPLISPPREYAAETAYLAAVLRRHLGKRTQEQAENPRGDRVRAEVLDLGSGGGHVAVGLTAEFSLTLVDISAQMLAVSALINPGCPHIKGDMRTIRLHRTFDAVLVHDAIDYIIGRANLRQVIATAAAHTKPGGIALFVPDYLKDTFGELTGEGGGGDDGSGRSASFTERTWDPDPGDDQVQADYEFTLRDADGTARIVRESHQLSAFSRSLWLSLLGEAGFDASADADADTRDLPGQRPGNLFVGVRPPAG
jgi:SAM-dependent methyltransferase